ncbi:response regulator [Salipiger aestuarii]|uniref:response regulator n=1 Tax=Salipiger aestuarii TaxID=568098 RepID=UPI001CC2BADC
MVEDNEINPFILSQMLAAGGHRLTVASNGRIGVERAAAQRVDIKPIDISMPEMDGATAARDPRRLGPIGADPDCHAYRPCLSMPLPKSAHSSSRPESPPARPSRSTGRCCCPRLPGRFAWRPSAPPFRSLPPSGRRHRFGPERPRARQRGSRPRPPTPSRPAAHCA